MKLENSKIQLVNNTIDASDINKLVDWLKTNPRLTKGDVTVELEKKWSAWLGVKYSVFVNSGSSANLAAFYSLMLSKKLKNKKVIVPVISWATTIAPAIQLGLDPIMCDCNADNLGIDIDNFKSLVRTHKPSTAIIVPVLGVPNDMEEIRNICDENNIFLIEDSCEAIGSKYNNKKIGTFGDLSTFSFYFGHHISTIEGGMVCTDNEELYRLILSIRSHGWDRDFPPDLQKEFRSKNGVSDFRALYTFYYPGFNLRSTDLQALIGISQLNKLDKIIEKRSKNFDLYQSLIKNKEWKITPNEKMFVSNFAYPIITKKINPLVKELKKNNIEIRPLICGSIGRQPFWAERFGEYRSKNADLVHDYGLYLPNNHEISRGEIELICNCVNDVISN